MCRRPERSTLLAAIVWVCAVLALFALFTSCGGGEDREQLCAMKQARKGVACWPPSKCPQPPPAPPPEPEPIPIPDCRFELKADGKLYWCCPLLTP